MNLDNRAWGTSPRLWDGGNTVAVGGVVHLIDEEAEESGGLFVRIRLELGVDLDDKGGSDGREQTSLRHQSARACLNDVYNIRISESRPNHLYISPEIPYRTPSPPRRNVCRIWREEPHVVIPGLLRFSGRVLTALWRDTK